MGIIEFGSLRKRKINFLDNRPDYVLLKDYVKMGVSFLSRVEVLQRLAMNQVTGCVACVSSFSRAMAIEFRDVAYQITGRLSSFSQ